MAVSGAAFLILPPGMEREHTVPGQGENRQDDRKIEGKGKSRRGRARKGPQEKELPQHGYTPGPLAPLLVKRFSDCL